MKVHGKRVTVLPCGNFSLGELWQFSLLGLLLGKEIILPLAAGVKKRKSFFLLGNERFTSSCQVLQLEGHSSQCMRAPPSGISDFILNAVFLIHCKTSYQLICTYNFIFYFVIYMPLNFVLLHWLRLLVQFLIGVLRVKCLVFYPELVGICSVLSHQV